MRSISLLAVLASWFGMAACSHKMDDFEDEYDYTYCTENGKHDWAGTGLVQPVVRCGSLAVPGLTQNTLLSPAAECST
jgi:hypothetical protein